MNVLEWKEGYESKKNYRSVVYKDLTAYLYENPNFKQRVIFPEPLVQNLQNCFDSLSILTLRYECSEQTVMDPPRDEYLLLECTIAYVRFFCSLSVVHGEQKREISFYHHINGLTQFDKQSEEKIACDIASFMVDFVENYSPFRLELATHQYKYKVPYNEC